MSEVSQSQATSSSTSTFVAALVFNAAVFGIELGIFTLVRPYFPAIYQPRTYVPPEGRRAKPLSQNIFLWPLAVFNADYKDIKQANGIDAYMFVRFLRMMVRYLLPVWLLSWVVLLPITAVGGDTSGLDQFNFGNVGRAETPRYAAHIILAWVFTIWMWWNIRHEMEHFVSVRQRWLIDPENASSAQASTILVTGVPQRYLTEAALTKLFSHLPGGVSKVWLNRNLKEMPDLYDRRMAACQKLESAETALLNTATSLRNKRLKKEAKRAKKEGRAPSDNSLDGRPLTENSIESGDAALAAKLVPQNKRPTHRLPLSFMPFSLPLIGKEVDSIDWARDEIAETTAALREARRTLARDVARTSAMGESAAPKPDVAGEAAADAQTYPPLNSAFVLFNRQIAAHLAVQSLVHHGPYRMAHKSINVAPQDVIWGNLNMNPYEARIRMAISWAITIGLIVLWAFPVAFVGAVSNIHSLCATYSWLAWMCKLPSPVVGILTGILPPALLAILMMLLPIVLRLLSTFEGTPQRTTVERSLMSRYFLFLVIHSFLIVTLSSGIIAALPQLVNDPSSVPSLLANNLPKAATFFLTYIILQGLTGTASGFLQVVALVLYYVKLFILGSTPRSIYNIKFKLRSVSWGTLFPNTTLLVVITIAYSIMSPIINGLAFGTFFLFYMLWKYLFLWQLDQPRASETGGLFFPTALQHVFVGLYIQQICLAALFFLVQDADGHPAAIPEGALMIVLIVFTAFFHIIIDNSYNPLKEYLPLTLAEKMAGPAEIAATPKASGELARAGSVHSEHAHEKGASGDSYGMTPRARSEDDAERGTPPSVHGAGSGEEGEEEEEGAVAGVDEDAGPKDFFHPASVEPQRVVWLPQDALGLAAAEAAAIRERGIAVSVEDARMDDKGHVDIQGAPPGEKTL